MVQPLQEVIHRLELGGGRRYLRLGLGLLALVVVLGGYNWRAFRNLATQEAMDSAQLGRNLAEGKGYSTLFIRPLSISLVKKAKAPGAGAVNDPAELKGQHPDLANPPLYPVLLAGLMKVLPFHYQLPANPKPSFWNVRGIFYRYQPDFIIALFNQVLFLVTLGLLFLLARRLFDPTVAWVSVILILATELFWRFTVSGLSTILLMLIFTVLVFCLVLLDEGVRGGKSAGATLTLAVAAGVCVGAGALTRYAFGWLLLPVLVFLIVFGGPRRFLFASSVLIVFAAMMTPWILRNYHLSGTPFGTAGYAILETTFLWPANRLQRSLEPDVQATFSLLPCWWKLMANLRQIVQSDLPKLGGSWLSAFFLVGLLVGFRNPALRRARYFLLMCLPLLVLVQALGRTQLSEDSPEINSENLLVLLAPLALVYGVGLFFVLLDQLSLPLPEMRYLVILAFGILSSLPMILVFLPPRFSPVVYPPYDPPNIQRVAGWLQPAELSMSDVPWAMAWYGERQSVWLTLRATPDPSDPNLHEDFLAINDYAKSIVALYLTPRSTDARFYSEWLAAGELSWGSFIIEALVNNELPPTFPLHRMLRDWLKTGQFVLTDWDRWNAPKPER